MTSTNLREVTHILVLELKPMFRHKLRCVPTLTLRIISVPMTMTTPPYPQPKPDHYKIYTAVQIILVCYKSLVVKASIARFRSVPPFGRSPKDLLASLSSHKKSTLLQIYKSIPTALLTPPTNLVDARRRNRQMWERLTHNVMQARLEPQTSMIHHIEIFVHCFLDLQQATWRHGASVHHVL